MRYYWFRKLLGDQRRVRAWQRLGLTAGDRVEIAPRVQIRGPANVSVGNGSMIGGRTLLDAWGELRIGRNCIINDEVKIFTATHDLASPTFEGVIRRVVIGDYVWLPHNVLVLPGVTIGDCAVIGSGTVVTKDVEPYAV